MYPGSYAKTHPDRAAFIMASTGEAVTYRAFDARSNQLAHLFRDHGLKRLDHFLWRIITGILNVAPPENVQASITPV